MRPGAGHRLCNFWRGIAGEKSFDAAEFDKRVYAVGAKGLNEGVSFGLEVADGLAKHHLYIEKRTPLDICETAQRPKQLDYGGTGNKVFRPLEGTIGSRT